jgi:hypothetical protein
MRPTLVATAKFGPRAHSYSRNLVDVRGGYVTNELAVVATQEQRHLVLSADTLAIVDEITYPSDAVSPDVLWPAGGGTWLTGDYATGHYQLWRIG